MLHMLFNLTRPLIVLDCETTGLSPERDRIVELGFQLWNAEGLMKEWQTYFRIDERISEHATKVHGIANAKLNACRACGAAKDRHSFLNDDACDNFRPWPRFVDIASNLAFGFRDCDYAGKNVRFDLRIVAAEMRRASVEWSYAGARIVDIDRLEALALPRTLGALHEKYVGRVHDGAHGALSDVRASTTVVCRQLEEHRTLPRDLDELHRLQWPGWIDSEGKFVMVDGVPCFGRWGKYAGRPMADREVNRPGRSGQTYWDFILNSDFSAEVKALAAEAKMGKFPAEEKEKEP